MIKEARNQSRSEIAKKQATTRKTHRGLLFVLLLVGFMTLAACAPSSSTTISYQTISAAEAKKMMDENKDVMIVDVRTAEEYKEGHIANALLLPVTDIEKEAAKVLPDKEAIILVYCRSGNRSKVASQTLAELGYVNVFDFGGISKWPYEIIIE